MYVYLFVTLSYATSACALVYCRCIHIYTCQRWINGLHLVQISIWNHQQNFTSLKSGSHIERAFTQLISITKESVMVKHVIKGFHRGGYEFWSLFKYKFIWTKYISRYEKVCKKIAIKLGRTRLGNSCACDSIQVKRDIHFWLRNLFNVLNSFDS